MKKTLLIAASVLGGISMAQAGVRFGIGIQIPGPPGAFIAPPPVYVQPAPIYPTPPPVVVTPPPVVISPPAWGYGYGWQYRPFERHGWDHDYYHGFHRGWGHDRDDHGGWRGR